MRSIVIYLYLASLVPRISAILVNVTIDDQFGDPTNGEQITYNPPSAWQTGQNCQLCTAKPSPASDAYMATWHDASFNPAGTATNNVAGQIIQASVSFTGSAVYVTCILTGSSVSPDGNTDMTFKIDGVAVGVFQQAPNNDTSYHFNTTVFSTSGLSNSLHNFTLESGHAGNKALVMLDSITYTTDNGLGGSSTSSSSPTGQADSSSSSSGGSKMPVIVGAIVGAIIVVGAAIIGLFVYMRKRRRPERGARVSIDSSPMASAFERPLPRDLVAEMRSVPYVLPETPAHIASAVPRSMHQRVYSGAAAGVSHSGVNYARQNESDVRPETSTHNFSAASHGMQYRSYPGTAEGQTESNRWTYSDALSSQRARRDSITYVQNGAVSDAAASEMDAGINAPPAYSAAESMTPHAYLPDPHHKS
ncbi:hypothetical protein DFH11DRAFT_254255 [Phellopilus nigrolimitatus]|nr:hypothetical protein DFH11DRAFT_254255 [Phellopilus nigrolimitatus]